MYSLFIDSQRCVCSIYTFESKSWLCHVNFCVVRII